MKYTYTVSIIHISQKPYVHLVLLVLAVLDLQLSQDHPCHQMGHELQDVQVNLEVPSLHLFLWAQADQMLPRDPVYSNRSIQFTRITLLFVLMETGLKVY